MKTLVTLSLLAALLSTARADTIINVDFNGVQGSESVGGTYVGAGSAGGGTTFNGVLVDSRATDAYPNGNYALDVNSGALEDSNGGTTGVTFAINDVGGDNQSVTDALHGDYLYNNDKGSGGSNNAGIAGSAFTINGLGSATTADLYFYSPSGGDFLHTTLITATGPSTGTYGTYNGVNAYLYHNVVVTSGTISGAFGSSPGDLANQYNILDGFTVDFASSVPEPSTYALVGFGFVGLLAVRRFRNLSKI